MFWSNLDLLMQQQLNVSKPCNLQSCLIGLFWGAKIRFLVALFPTVHSTMPSQERSVWQHGKNWGCAINEEVSPIKASETWVWWLQWWDECIGKSNGRVHLVELLPFNSTWIWLQCSLNWNECSPNNKSDSATFQQDNQNECKGHHLWQTFLLNKRRSPHKQWYASGFWNQKKGSGYQKVRAAKKGAVVLISQLQNYLLLSLKNTSSWIKFQRAKWETNMTN